MNKKLTILLYSILIASISSPFIQTTSYSNSTGLYICLFVSVLIAFLFKNKRVHIVWIVISSVYLMYMYVNPLSLNFGSWIEYFSNDISIKLLSFVNRDVRLIPQEIGLLVTYVVIASSISVTANIKGIWKVYLVCYIIFYMILSAFLKIQFHESIVITIGVSLFIGFIENLPTAFSPINTHKIVIIGILIAILISGSNYVKIYQSIHLYLIENSINLRSDLSAANFYENFKLSERSSTASKSGFSNDDSRLGGPLYMDYTEAYIIAESAQSYWRVNSKYEYTGLGWSNNQHLDETTGRTLPLQIGKQTLNNQNSITHEFIKVDKSIDYIPIPLGFSEYEISSNIEHTIHSNNLLGFYDINGIFLNHQNNGMLDNTIFTTSPPISSADILNEVVPSLKTEEFVKGQTTRYIPQNVINLALEITAEGNSMYEKVKLLENYLSSSSQLKYSLSDVPYVPEGGNFVEQFLFESQVGYCEHFASAMVVMAQSLGIPARYAKGFSSGSHFNNTTTIKNSDAHAWPEIYFEEYGWIAFEPTPSFSIPTQNQTDNQNDNDLGPLDTGVNIEKPSNEQDNIQVNPSSPQEIEAIQKQNNLGVTILWVLGLSILVSLSLIYKLRIRISISYTKHLLKHNKLGFTQAFSKITRILNSIIPIDESELLSQYALRLDENMKSLLIPLINEYEFIKFSNSQNDSSTQDHYAIMMQLLDYISKLNSQKEKHPL